LLFFIVFFSVRLLSVLRGHIREISVYLPINKYILESYALFNGYASLSVATVIVQQTKSKRNYIPSSA